MMNIAVDAERQRQGRRLGAAAPSSTSASATSTPASRSRCAAPTSVAIDLYEREGFRAAGVRRRYYQDNGEDALDHVAHARDARRAARRRAQPRPSRHAPA